jgi:hypothetical protein
VGRVFILILAGILLLGVATHFSAGLPLELMTFLALTLMLLAGGLMLANCEKFKRNGLAPNWIKDLPIDDPENREKERVDG